MLQIYRRHPCRSVISIKLQNNFIEISLQHGCFPVNLLHIFRTPFYKNTYGRLLLQKAPPPSQIFDKIQNAPLLNIYNIYTYICYIYIYIICYIYALHIYILYKYTYISGFSFRGHQFKLLCTTSKCFTHT